MMDEDAITIAVRAERERCAEIAKQVESEWRGPPAKMAARQIRQRIEHPSGEAARECTKCGVSRSATDFYPSAHHGKTPRES